MGETDVAERDVLESKEDLTSRFYLSVCVYPDKLEISRIQALLRQRNFMAGKHYTLFESFKGPLEPTLIDVRPGRGQDKIMVSTGGSIIKYLKEVGVIDR